MLRLFGNIDKAKRELQRKMNFPRKVLQIHRAAVQFDNMAEAGSPAAQKKAKAAQAGSDGKGQYILMKYKTKARRGPTPCDSRAAGSLLR